MVLGAAMKDAWQTPLFLGVGLLAGTAIGDQPAPERPAEVHYAPEEDLEAVDVGLIDGARAGIDVAAYVLTDRRVIEALRRAGARGVRVRIYRDGGMADRVGEADVEAVIAPDAPGIEIREKRPDGALMHEKGYCVDGALLRTGSANFSYSGLKKQDNDLVVLRWAGVCAPFTAKFERAWDGAK